MIYEIKKHFAIFKETYMLFMLIFVLQNCLGIIEFQNDRMPHSLFVVMMIFSTFA